MSSGDAPLYQCQLCGAWKPVSGLLKQYHKLVAAKGENRLAHSQPADGLAYWPCSATWVGTVSSSSSRFWIRRDGEEQGGAPTWRGDGRLVGGAANVLDVSSWTTLWLRAQGGASEHAYGSVVTIEMGVVGNGTDYPIRTFELSAGDVMQGSIAVSSIDAGDRGSVTPYFDVTASEATDEWWVELIEVLKDGANEQWRRGVHLETRGSSLVRAASEVQVVQLDTCAKCRRNEDLNMMAEPAIHRPEILEQVPQDLSLE